MTSSAKASLQYISEQYNGSDESTSSTDIRSKLRIDLKYDPKTNLIREGYLMKKSKWAGKWNMRYFVIESDFSHSLCYYPDENKRTIMGKIPLGPKVIVHSYNTGSLTSWEIELSSDGSKYYFNTLDESSRDLWIQSLMFGLERPVSDDTILPSPIKNLSTIEDNRPFLAKMLHAVSKIPKALQIGHWGKPNDILSALEMAKELTGLSDMGFSHGGKTMINMYETVRQLGMQRSACQYSSFGYYMVRTLNLI